MSDSRVHEFDGIYLGGSMIPAVGKLKLATNGLAWRNSNTGNIITVLQNDMKKFSWYRVAKNYEVKLQCNNGIIYKFDGFAKEDYEGLASFIKSHYRIVLEQKELSLRGWNWGRTEFQGTQLSFLVGNRQVFEIPLTEVANTTSTRNEVALEFTQPESGNKRIKEDTITEMRFYIPGMATIHTEGEDLENSVKKTNNGDNEGEDNENLVLGEDGEAMTAAAVFHDTIKQKADLRMVTGEGIGSFQDLLCLTPRGRFEVDFYPTFLRLRGKTHDYKINYVSVIKLFLLPKPDEMHMMFVVGLDPPIRQGQTRYPFLVFQFARDEEIDITLQIDEELLKTKYEGRLQKSYDAPTFEVVCSIFKGLTGQKVIVPGNLYKSHHLHHAVKCSLKANESYLYPLDKSFLFIPKPPTLISHNEIASVTFSRVGGGITNTRTFEMKFNMKNGVDYQFGGINREEYPALNEFLQLKKIKVKNELSEENTLNFHDELSSSEDEDDRRLGRIGGDDMDNNDEDSSEDEDFVATESESDVEEEFDENYGGSDSSEEEEEKSHSRKHSRSSSKNVESESEIEEIKENKEKKKKANPKKESKSVKRDEKPNKRKRQKEEGAPKRPMSSYMYFSQDKRNEVKSNNPDATFTELGKIIGNLWKKISPEEKEKYEKKAREDKERYKREMEEFEKKKKATSVSSTPSKSSKSGNPKKKVKSSHSESKYKSKEVLDDESDNNC
jgi:structure-specific recognition protein 1